MFTGIASGELGVRGERGRAGGGGRGRGGGRGERESGRGGEG